MKRMGRTHRPFYRICAMDSRSPRDGRVIEELGFYDPMVTDTDARVQLKKERVDHWISVGALPTPKVGVLLRKYGTAGTHLEQQQAALERMGVKAQYVPPERPEPEPEPEAPAAEAPAAEAPAEEAAPAEAGEAPAEQAEGGGEEQASTEAPAEGGEEKKEEGGE
jgi:small subunit ribosomal protein S16